VTVSMIYALYRSAYAAAARLAAAPGQPRDLSVVARGLTALERAIVELALHDLTNGTPARCRARFDRAVEQGADLLRSLGLRPDPQAGPGAGRGGLGEAA
jgi:hypothetical protein